MNKRKSYSCTGKLGRANFFNQSSVLSTLIIDSALSMGLSTNLKETEFDPILDYIVL